MNRDVIVSVSFRSREEAVSVLSAARVAAGTRVLVDGVGEVRVTGVVENPGMSGEDIVISVVISLSTGVPASLAAAWIWEKLGASGRRELTVGTDAQPVDGVADVERAIPADGSA